MNFSLTPFFEAELAVQIHIVSALVAGLTGLVIFMRRKGTHWHRIVGRISVSAMGLLALSGLFIHQIKIWGPFSPLHIFSLTTLFGIYYAINTVRKGNIVGHQMTLRGLYLGGIVFAGALTFSRDLVMHRIFFGENGGNFIPSPSEVPGGIITFALVGGFAIFLITFLTGGRGPRATARNNQRKVEVQ